MTEGRSDLWAAFRRIETVGPPWLAGAIRWLRHPASRWVRIPIGILLILGGVFSILPFLGLWMLPLGLLLLAADVPFLRKPMARFAHACLDGWQRLSAWWAARRTRS